MGKLDMSKYKSVAEIIEGIKSIEIQGATNVAIATFEGMKLYLGKDHSGIEDYDEFLLRVHEIGSQLAEARPNEPLAKNGVKYILNNVRIDHPGLNSVDEAKPVIVGLIDKYLEMISKGKENIEKESVAVMKDIEDLFTHCHSSTVEHIIQHRHEEFPELMVVCTETRPLYQGRITATHLHEAGIDTTLIADSAAESYIIGEGGFDPDAVFVGCDQITMDGDILNKIGTWGIAHAAYYASKPIYVVGSILKTDVSTAYKPLEIEMRDPKEIWPDAPEGLKMVNPAFERVSNRFITGFITEFGILKPNQISKTIQKHYQWLF